MKKVHIVFFIKFAFVEKIFYVLTDTAALLVKQLSYLCLCQPYSSVISIKFDSGLAVINVIIERDYLQEVFINDV